MQLERLKLIVAASLVLTAAGGLDRARAQDVDTARPATDAATLVSTAAPAAPAGPGIAAADRLSRGAARQDHADDVAALRAHYLAAPSRLLWVADGAFQARARAVMEEIGKADDWGLAASSFSLPGLSASGDEAAIDADIRLSLEVLRYARHARGGRFDPSRITDALDRSPTLLEPATVLSGIVAADDPALYLRKLHPQHPQFEKLRQLYLAARSGTLPAPPEPKVAEAPAEEPRGKRRKRKKAAAAKPATPPAVTLDRILVNMEQWRWMPEDLGALHVMVNIPEFQLRVIKQGSEIYTERVVTGTPRNPTPIFSKQMQTVVFQPGWGVPSGIKVKELLPGLLSGRDSISSRGLVVRHRGRQVSPMSIDWRTTDIRRVSIVQPPGPRNALGQVKFLFPNRHDVYMHDTPSKSLFNASTRAFSHGCVRVRNPMKFAELIFAETGGWSPQRVASASRARPEHEVGLPGRVEVHLTYFTLIVDESGQPRTFADIYGHEKLIAAGIEGRAEQVARKQENLTAVRQAMVSRARARPPRAAAYEPRPRGGSSGGFFGWF